MISGIVKLYIQLRSNVYSPGFSCNGKRLGFSLKQNIHWIEIPIQRDSTSDAGSVSNLSNSFNIEAKTVGLNLDLLKYNGKRVVCCYITNNNQKRIIGVDQPANISISYSSGEKLGDNQGMIIKIFTETKMLPEIYDTTVLVPDATCFLRADSVELYGNYVMRMIDKSGNEYHGISSEQYSSNPYLPNFLNGKPVVHINITSLYITGPYIGNTSLWGGGINGIGVNDEYTILMVVQPRDTIDTYFIINDNLQVRIHMASELVVVPRGAGSSFILETFFDFKVIAIRCPVNGGNADLHVNNVLLGTVNTGTAAQQIYSNKTFLGITNGNDQMYLAEFRVWDKVLTDEQLDTITRQVMAYYSL